MSSDDSPAIIVPQANFEGVESSFPRDFINPNRPTMTGVRTMIQNGLMDW